FHQTGSKNSLDVAVLEYAEQDELVGKLQHYRKVDEIPFDFVRRRMSVIVRHGNTFAPGAPVRRIGARSDSPSVVSGRAQAVALAHHFAGISFDRCLASPLARTRETAAIIAPHLAPEPTDWSREIDHGPDEGALEKEVVARIGADASAQWNAAASPPPGWIVDAPGRIAAWRDFFATASGT
ncbi:hypothetical protein OY671_010209, partial [Metschnikowia pulcherrima]